MKLLPDRGFLSPEMGVQEGGFAGQKCLWPLML